MNEMVERVARVICAQWGECSPEFINKRWHLNIPVAIAVLEAMREPTEAMCEANWTQPISGGVDDGYRAMIDRALK